MWRVTLVLWLCFTHVLIWILKDKWHFKISHKLRSSSSPINPKQPGALFSLLNYVSITHRIHVWYIIFTMFHKNQPFMQIYHSHSSYQFWLACVWVVNHQVIRGMTTDETTETAFAWSLTLIAKIMVPWPGFWCFMVTGYRLGHGY